eukprot:3178893-Lingulodinium_polyedra.AAC.1
MPPKPPEPHASAVSSRRKGRKARASSTGEPRPGRRRGGVTGARAAAPADVLEGAGAGSGGVI